MAVTTLKRGKKGLFTDIISIVPSLDEHYSLILNDTFSEGFNTEHWEKITKANTPWRYNKSTINNLFEQTEDGLVIKIIENTNQDSNVPLLEKVTLNEDSSNISDVIAYQSSKYLTGGIWTKGDYMFKYGRVEIVASMTPCNGSWDSIWVSGSKNNVANANGTKHITTGEDGYNDTSEIDLLEYYPHNGYAHTTIHDNYLNSTLTDTETNNAEQERRKIYQFQNANTFKTYVCDVLPDHISVYIDNQKILTYNNLDKTDSYGFMQYPFTLDGNPLRVILDTQYGGNKYLLNKLPNEGEIPASMTIKSVKMWKYNED